jgi:hypothetical protein
MRLLALCLPLYEPGANLKVLCFGGLQTSDADGVARRNFYFVIAGLTRQSMRPRSLFRFSAWFRWPHFSMDHRVKPGGDERKEAGSYWGI